MFFNREPSKIIKNIIPQISRTFWHFLPFFNPPAFFRWTYAATYSSARASIAHKHTFKFLSHAQQAHILTSVVACRSMRSNRYSTIRIGTAPTLSIGIIFFYFWEVKSCTKGMSYFSNNNLLQLWYYMHNKSRLMWSL